MAKIHNPLAFLSKVLHTFSICGLHYCMVADFVTWNIIGALVSLLGESYFCSSSPSLLYIDRQNLVPDVRCVSIFIHYLTERPKVTFISEV